MSLSATVQSIDGEVAVLALDDGQTLRVPLSACEGQAKPGLKVRLVVAMIGSEDAGRTGLARELLNEILAP